MMYRHSGTLSNTKSGLGVNTKSRRTEGGRRLRRKGKVFGIGDKADSEQPVKVMSKRGLKSVYCVSLSISFPTHVHRFFTSSLFCAIKTDHISQQVVPSRMKQ